MKNRTREQNIAIAVTLAIALPMLFLFTPLGSVFNFGGPSITRDFVPGNTQSASVSEDGGLTVQDISVGAGKEAREGDKVTVDYVGILSDGTQFDSSFERGEPFTFTLGSGQVIEGWDQGILGMQEGGKRVLLIPAHLGYGDQRVGPIPPNSTLIFEVTLLELTAGE